jgi:hypothetical protein
MSEMKLEIEATEPMELLRHPMRAKVWIRHVEGGYFPLIEIRGRQEEIWRFVADHWGEDEADARIHSIYER